MTDKKNESEVKLDKTQHGMNIIDSIINKDRDMFSESSIGFIKLKSLEIMKKLTEAAKAKSAKSASDKDSKDEPEDNYEKFLKHRVTKKKALKKVKKED